jgi:hypothetical protein
VTSDEAATAKLSAKVSVRCPHRRARRFSLRSATVGLTPATTKRVVLKASKRAKRRLRAALACKGVKARATLKITAVDAAGNSATRTKTVRVR